MNTLAASDGNLPVHAKLGPVTLVVFTGLLAPGLPYNAWSLTNDVRATGAQATTWVPYVLLGVALLVALGFEFVSRCCRSS